MRHPRLYCCALILIMPPALLLAAEPVTPEYNRDIRPILSDNCFRCHGADSANRQADLRLDLPDAAVLDREGRRAISPGDPDDSDVFRRVTSNDPDERMPPPESGSRLTRIEIDRIRRWIEQGAEYQPHWSFLPPRKSSLPDIRERSWPRQLVDYFILARLDEEGLKPSVEANRSTWLRRVSLDLIGLPPTPEERDAFLQDGSPSAYDTVVDRLLQSPHFGERMALDWLDAARYADTNGMFSDMERPVWRWRDWVIDAFNRNKPFDEFSIEQLAGDLLPSATLDQKIATGFNRNHTVTNETGIIDEEYRVEYVADRLETTGTVWMGLTVGCARCHDHKYDPISQKEYYQLFAFFNNGPETGLAPRELPPLLTFSTPEYEQEQKSRKARCVKYDQTWQRFAERAQQDQSEWEKTALQSLQIPPRDQLAAEFQLDRILENAVPGTPPAAAIAPVNYQPGVRGTSLKYDGRFFAEFDPTLTLDSDEPWTISLWASVEGTSLACILSKIMPVGDRRGLEIIWLKGRLKIALIHNRDENAIQIVTRTPTAANRWNHLALTYDGSKRASGLKVYINGELQDVRVDRDTLTGRIVNDRPWKIGYRDNGLGFSGRIDQLRIYRQALGSRDIREALYAGEQIAGILEVNEAARTDSQQERLKDYYIRRYSAPELRTAWIELLAAQQADAEWTTALPKTLVMEELPVPRETVVLNRGQYDQRGEKVVSNVPAVFPPMADRAPTNRLGFARWLMQSEHPLTARVIVNRYWTLLLGEGLVKTSNDFGLQGEPPSHPRLLDWLAVDFRENAWNLKRLVKQIVLSATYRQSSVVRPALLSRDPENRLLARGPRFRLPGELIRDQALAVSGLLSRRFGGPGVKPYQPPGLWEAVSYDGNLTYFEDRGESLYRRSIYTFWKRQAPPPSLVSFDSPTRETCTMKRPRTNTPLQALVLLNDPTFVEAARKLAERVLIEETSAADRVRSAFRRSTGRTPDSDEVHRLISLLQHQSDILLHQPSKAHDLLSVGESSIDASLDKCELAAWTIVCSVLFNLDEFVTRP